MLDFLKDGTLHTCLSRASLTNVDLKVSLFIIYISFFPPSFFSLFSQHGFLRNFVIYGLLTQTTNKSIFMLILGGDRKSK